MKLELFLIVGYYLFVIYFLYSLFYGTKYSVKHKVIWTLIVLLLPFIGAIVYTLNYKKQYGRPNKLMTMIR